MTSINSSTTSQQLSWFLAILHQYRVMFDLCFQLSVFFSCFVQLCQVCFFLTLCRFPRQHCFLKFRQQCSLFHFGLFEKLLLFLAVCYQCFHFLCQQYIFILLLLWPNRNSYKNLGYFDMITCWMAWLHSWIILTIITNESMYLKEKSPPKINLLVEEEAKSL